MHHPGQHTRNGNVQHSTNRQRRNHANRQITLRILGFLRGGRDRIETDVSKKYVSRARPDSRKAVRRVRMPVRTPIRAVDVVRAQRDHEQHDRHLDHHNPGIKPRALFNANHQNRRNHHRDQERRKVESDLHPKKVRRSQQFMRPLQQFRRLRPHDRRHFIEKRLRARHQGRVRSLRHLPGNHILGRFQRRPMIVSQPQRHLDVENIQQCDKVVRPPRRHRAGAHRVFQREVPADNPGNQLTQRRVSVSVGAAGQRNHGRELRIAQTCKRASQA